MFTLNIQKFPITQDYENILNNGMSDLILTINRIRELNVLIFPYIISEIPANCLEVKAIRFFLDIQTIGLGLGLTASKVTIPPWGIYVERRRCQKQMVGIHLTIFYLSVLSILY